MKESTQAFSVDSISITYYFALKHKNQPYAIIFDINTTSAEVACRKSYFPSYRQFPKKVLITLSETNTKFQKS